jgi:hypothetical protein
MHRRLTLAATAACALAVWLPAGSAAARDSDPIVVAPGDPDARYQPPTIEIGVTVPGRPGASDLAGSRAGGSPVCTWVVEPEMEAWVRRLPGRLPTPGVDRVDPRAHLLARVCDGVVTGYAWSSPAGTVATTLPSPAELARDAYALLRLPVPLPRRSPELRLADGRPAVLVGEHTWVWTDRSVFTPRARRLQVGPVWVRVTAMPIGLEFDPGDGSPAVGCAGPGTPFVTGREALHAPSPTCDVVYRRSSAGQPGGVVSGVWAIRWRVSWVGGTAVSAESGALQDLMSQIAAAFAVAEAQALVAE